MKIMFLEPAERVELFRKLATASLSNKLADRERRTKALVLLLMVSLQNVVWLARNVAKSPGLHAVGPGPGFEPGR